LSDTSTTWASRSELDVLRELLAHGHVHALRAVAENGQAAFGDLRDASPRLHEEARLVHVRRGPGDSVHEGPSGAARKFLREIILRQLELVRESISKLRLGLLTAIRVEFDQRTHECLEVRDGNGS